MDEITYKLRQKVPHEELDYIFLKNFLSAYNNPRDKITRLIKNGDIVRVKKGLYIFGSKLRKAPYSKETLANLIYGPSYISLEYALSFYGMIPEKVETVTSITSKRNKVFTTPVGIFTYIHLNHDYYHFGINLHQQDNNHAILMATKEKALSDLLYFNAPKHFRDKNDLKSYLTGNLRINIHKLENLKWPLLRKIATAYKSRTVNLLLEIFK